jgi:hypothetical protein
MTNATHKYNTPHAQANEAIDQIDAILANSTSPHKATPYIAFEIVRDAMKLDGCAIDWVRKHYTRIGVDIS